MKQRASAMERANKTALVSYGVMNVILIACYLIEVVKKSRTPGYFAVFCALAIVPFLMNYVMYKKNRASSYVQYAMPAGFFVFYMFIVFTTVSPVAYVYAFIVAVALIPLGNIRVSGAYMIAVSLVNVVQVVYLALGGHLTAADLPNVEIRIASVVVFGIYLVVSTKVMADNSMARLKEIEAEKQRAAALAKELLSASEQMTGDISLLADKMGILEGTTGQTVAAMQEVSEGTNETAQSVQTQMQKTVEIQSTIGHVGEAAKMIETDIRDTQKELRASQVHIRELIEQVGVSNRANENMSGEMNTLISYTDQMQSIIDVIDNVATQTRLLSLNASIEAARAGEAGRGFAVVADEISSLAGQTQEATEHITGLINSISAELKTVVGVIGKVIESAKQQNEAADLTAKSFETISGRIDGMFEHVETTTRLMESLEEANAVITHGIETISAATEEVTAHSSETLSISSENSRLTDEVGVIIGTLSETANKLAAITQEG